MAKEILRRSQRQKRGAEHLPPAHLIELHQHSLIHVLILGGTAAERDQVARDFHQHSPVGGGAFVRFDCLRDEEALRDSLLTWASLGLSRPAPGPLAGVEQGTLFLDAIGSLSLATQRLVLELACPSAQIREASSAPTWGGRLMVGSPRDLAPAVADGAFDSALYDCVDKVRIELDRDVEGSSC